VAANYERVALIRDGRMIVDRASGQSLPKHQCGSHHCCAMSDLDGLISGLRFRKINELKPSRSQHTSSPPLGEAALTACDPSMSWKVPSADESEKAVAGRALASIESVDSPDVSVAPFWGRRVRPEEVRMQTASSSKQASGKRGSTPSLRCSRSCSRHWSGVAFVPSDRRPASSG
jgi:hypothetical protein